MGLRHVSAHLILSYLSLLLIVSIIFPSLITVIRHYNVKADLLWGWEISFQWDWDIYIYTHMYIHCVKYIHIDIHTHIHTREYIYTLTCTYIMCVYTYSYAHTPIHAYTQAYIHKYSYTCFYIFLTLLRWSVATAFAWPNSVGAGNSWMVKEVEGLPCIVWIE